MVEVTLGQLIKDNPMYKKHIVEAIKVKRQKRIPPVNINVIDIEDWGDPKIDIEISGYAITCVPVDGGAGVNVTMEQMASDLRYMELKPTPKIL